MATARIEERKARDKQARHERILRAAREIAESEGWCNVTVRRLADEISYSQPVLYSHFASREEIVSTVAIRGFQEIGTVLEKARKKSRPSRLLEAVATSYLTFAIASPALYEAMFTLGLNIPFGEADTPSELRYAFSQILVLFADQGSQAPVRAELFWASLHGIAELSRTKRFPAEHQRSRIQLLVELFSINRSG